MRAPLYRVDAFAERPFAGNPAAVVPLEDWPDDATLQAVAAENAMPGCAFIVPAADDNTVDYAIRVFTPTTEVTISGHTTLSAGHVVLSELRPERDSVRFTGRSGPLAVARDGGALTLDFPAIEPETEGAPDEVAAALGTRPTALLKALDWMAVFDDEAQIRALAPDLAAVAALDCRGLMATAPGKDCDFVSRFFAPGAGLPEDQVTGSAHCMMAPWWARRVGRDRLEARQLSPRGGALLCEARGERVAIGGRAITVLRGTIEI